MFSRRTWLSSPLSILVTACTVLPSLPDNYQFPVDEILRYSACELRKAYRELNGKYPNFNAGEYAIAIALQPKVDLEFTGKAGLTGKNVVNKPNFFSWALGAATGGGAPGAGFDARGHQDGKVSYNVKSSQLINDVKFPLDCVNWSEASHALTENLEIRPWLLRTAEAAAGHVGKLTNVDSQSFTAEIYIKFDAGGTFTYNFSLGTDFASASAQYWIDEFLLITISHEVPKLIIYTNTLPSGTDKDGKLIWRKTNSAAEVQSYETISPETKLRLDLLQLQQSIQNLPNGTPR